MITALNSSCCLLQATAADLTLCVKSDTATVAAAERWFFAQF